MTQQYFLSRKTFGTPNYFLIALLFACVIAAVPRAARLALHSNTNKAEDWLPSTYTESNDLRWFRRHFISEGFILVTWDGCTLGDARDDKSKLKLLEQKLRLRTKEEKPSTASESHEPAALPAGVMFRKILTGPSMIERLTSPPLGLTYHEAVRRLEGALVGPPARDAEGNPLDDSTRTTCLVAYLAGSGKASNKDMRNVVDYVKKVAIEECGVPEPELRMGGPTCDNVAIDRAGSGSLSRLALLSGVVGLAISYWCFRNIPLTAMVVAVGAISAVTSLAIVFYYGVIEVLIGGYDYQKYGKMDAVLMSMPAVVYVLGLSGAIHLVNYYRDARIKHGLKGAVERAVRIAWVPCSLAALTTAVGLGSLAASDIVPIKKFGAFTAAAVLATVGVLFSLMPVYLHRFPPKTFGGRKWEDFKAEDAGLPGWASVFARWLTSRYALVTAVGLALMVLVGFGTTRIESTVRLLKLLDSKADLIQDYTWVEHHMANLVPMEIVLTVPPEKCRSGDQHAEEDGQQYKMTMLERLAMARRVLERIEELPAVSRTLSVSTFAPDESQNTSAAVRRGEDYTKNESVEDSRESLRDYLQIERDHEGHTGPGSRELWRISARVTALKDIDYGQFTEELREEVEPVLTAYRQRDILVRDLHGEGKQLEGARICVLFRGDLKQTEPTKGGPEDLLASLLKDSKVTDRVDGRKGDLKGYNLAFLEYTGLPAEQHAAILKALASYDAVVVASADVAADARQLAAQGVPIVDMSNLPPEPGSAAVPLAAGDEPRDVRAVYTGIIPLVFKTQRQLLVSLRQSIAWATVLIAGVMAVVFRSVLAGLVAMLPNVFPIFIVFGTLGWLGIKIDIGIMMTASVALGVAVDNTVHLVTWFRHGQRMGMDRRTATLVAYERCATAMVQTALVGGCGLVVFAFSSFTPTQQFGYLMITILMTALVGDLVLLPALLCGPLGRCFESHLKGSSPPPDVQALALEAAGNMGDGPAPAGDESTDQPATSGNGQPPGDESVRRATDGENLISPANIALRDKLRSFRRSS